MTDFYLLPGKGESLIEAYNKWRGWADEKVCCDFGFKVALPNICEDILQDMHELTTEEFGINSFFVSMEGENKLNDEDLMRAFEHIVSIGGLAQVHAASGEIIARNIKKMLHFI